jgi:hypothetical protein
VPYAAGMSGDEPDPIDAVVLTGRLARWLSDRAVVEGGTEAEIVEEALAVRWGRQLGDAFQEVWGAGGDATEAEADELVEAEVYGPRREQRRA